MSTSKSRGATVCAPTGDRSTPARLLLDFVRGSGALFFNFSAYVRLPHISGDSLVNTLLGSSHSHTRTDRLASKTSRATSQALPWGW